MSRRRFAKRNASVESPREVPLHIEANASFFTAQDALLAANHSPIPSPPHSPSPSRSPPNDDPSPPPLDSAVDRYSCASLPLPSQIPFHALLKTPEPIWHPPMRCPPEQDRTSSDSSSGPSSRSSLSIDSSNPTTQSSRSSTDPEGDAQGEKKADDRKEVRQAAQEQPSQVPSSPKSPSPQQVTRNDSPIRAPQPVASPVPPKPSAAPPPPVTNPTHRPIHSHVPTARPVSPFRAPMPPPQHQSRTSAWADHGTAMRRFMTPAQLQHAANSNSHSPFPSTRPPQSPVQPPSSSSPPFGFASASSSSSRAYQHRSYPPQQQQPSFSPATLASSASSTISYPPPEPPTILPGDTEDGNSRTGPFSHLPAPYASFLSRAPQPADTWIRVETSREEYKLNIRLPGFDRDSITLATKRRRILHIMADSWVGVGGHFERRIAFGYDADLGHVRAEFDGDMLHITVPRRDMGITWSAPASNSGRARI
ncbi:hypothetical protein D9619_001448 [Psilocybe cf. subviscida]|uniref:SHSP domain-containing protein n=1 Tax=Psilocybe cf. subviscida TaxID=2480587 RepID=A0A8H5F3T5_9AGAR|nr:hypothetical protein D9619_001448 [Psilocybe cf. subviscida]